MENKSTTGETGRTARKGEELDKIKVKKTKEKCIKEEIL